VRGADGAAWQRRREEARGKVPRIPGARSRTRCGLWTHGACPPKRRSRLKMTTCRRRRRRLRAPRSWRSSVCCCMVLAVSLGQGQGQGQGQGGAPLRAMPRGAKQFACAVLRGGLTTSAVGSRAYASTKHPTRGKYQPRKQMEPPPLVRRAVKSGTRGCCGGRRTTTGDLRTPTRWCACAGCRARCFASA